MSKIEANIFGKEGWTPKRLCSLKGKTYLITGANTGAGFEATKVLISKGAKVVILSRNAKKVNDAIHQIKLQFKDADIEFIKIDLASLESVRSAANIINNSIEKIDALICNAAIAQVSKQVFTSDGFESQIAVNHYGHFLLCGLLFDKINNSNGRIVVVSSLGYKMGLKTIKFEDMNWNKNYHPNNTYCHSKLAQMIFAYELQNRIKEANANVKVYVCHPGASKTSLINENVNSITRFVWSLMALTPMVQTALKGAYPELMCATEECLNEQAFYGPTGRMNWIGPVGECKVESFVFDRKIALKLWDISEKNTGIKWLM